MTQPILVTGGSGTLGRVVVARLLAAGHTVRVLSRRPRLAGGAAAIEWMTGDLVSGDGLVAAVTGVAAVVHCASDPRRPRVDMDGTGNLIEAARATGAPHVVGVSIVGVDSIPYRYYRAKLAAERLIEASGLPWTILRATQFHQLVLLVAQRLARLPVVPVPAETSFQPIDAVEVAERLVIHVAGPASGRVPDVAGPQVRTAADLLRAYLTAVGWRRPILPVRLPGAVFAGYRQGGHLAPDRAVGQRTWEEFLTARTGPSAADGTTLQGRV